MPFREGATIPLKKRGRYQPLSQLPSFYDIDFTQINLFFPDDYRVIKIRRTGGTEILSSYHQIDKREARGLSIANFFYKTELYIKHVITVTVNEFVPIDGKIPVRP
jgi:3-dehydroquinate dehydratase